MAQKYPYAKSAQLLYRPAEGPPFFQGWTADDVANDDLLCAEMSRLAYATKPSAEAALHGIGFTLATKGWIGGETPEERKATKGTDGFIATKGPLTVLAFRGTEANKPEDMLADGITVATPWDDDDPGRGKVHKGFKDSYDRVREGIAAILGRPAGGRLLITGHSLGAGLATLAASEHAARKPALITFGSPRVGDAQFASTLTNLDTIHRFVDCCDLVTRIPPERFDLPHVNRFLEELIPRRLLDGPARPVLLGGVATALAAVLAAAHVQPEYTHVGDVLYADHDRRRVTASKEQIAADQADAREAYDVQPKLDPASHIDKFKTQLKDALVSVLRSRDLTPVRDAIRNFGFEFFQADPVPLRDLADHAPLNYVTVLAP